jgi:hypothetical protein
MAIITATTYQSATNQTLSSGDATACATWCLAVDAAIKKLIYPYQLESSTVTGYCDAPTRDVLFLPVYPIRTLTSLYLNPAGNGQSANFTSDYLLTEGDDYYMPLDQPDGLSRWGKVLRRGSATWGYETGWMIDRLAGTVTPNRGAIKYVVSAGHTSVPDDAFAAAVLAVSLLMKRKEGGVPSTSESWNGYSTSYASPFIAGAAVRSPDVMGLLEHYLPINCAGA